MSPVGRGVVILRYAPGSESTEQREAGFLETMEREFPELSRDFVQPICRHDRRIGAGEVATTVVAVG